MAARARSGPPIPSIASTPSLSSTLSEHAATDARPLTDLFADIHRLKHNCRRVDHPCQLPPALLFRLIALFTRPGEVALDPFNGAGTTTLAAHLLGRRYIGVESSLAYHKLAERRHHEIARGLDPFRKENRVPSSKNSPVRRMERRRYPVAKKELQLDARRVARELGRLPTRDDMTRLGRHPIKYYDSFFASWGEVCAAARATGMNDTPHIQDSE